MVLCEQFYEIMQENGINFFTGVPDSTFKDWLNFLFDEHNKKVTTVIACNECEAIATAAGHHLATGKIGCVYMQNSGEGKTVNPLTSLCDKEVYSIPMLLMIGWRGQPGERDEPQHKKMGRIMIPLLDVLEIPYRILSENLEEIKKDTSEMIKLAKRESKPAAIIIKSGVFEEYASKNKNKNDYEMSREEAMHAIMADLKGDEAIIATTGKTSRELFEYRVKRRELPRDFYTVGSMGCSASIANSIAINKQERKILIFDGDGAAIMQLGALATIGHYGPKNLIHIIFDNESYESTGNQSSVSSSIDFEKIALSCGYKTAFTIKAKKELSKIKSMLDEDGPVMVVLKVNQKSRKDLGRPNKTPIENKQSFMDFLNGTN